MVIFDLPGPANVESELQDLIPFLEQKSGFKSAANCKIRAIKQSIPNVTDYIPIRLLMRVWLEETEGKDGFARYRVDQAGINVHTNEFQCLQAAWAVPLTQSQEKVLIKLPKQIAAQVEVLHSAKGQKKPKKRWWQFWK